LVLVCAADSHDEARHCKGRSSRGLAPMLHESGHQLLC